MRAGRLVGVGAAGGELQRIEEGLDQADLLVPVAGLLSPMTLKSASKRSTVSVQHRVAEAIDHVRELGDDRRIDRGVVDLGRGEEDVDLRLDLARELLEHEVLVLHLGAEARRLEQALAVPLQRVDPAGVVGSVGDGRAATD